MKKIIFMVLVMMSVCSVVLAYTDWNVRSDGNCINGGGFVHGASGTNWTLQANPQYTFDITSDGTTAITSDGEFTADMVGNYAGRTSSAVLKFAIVSVTDASNAVADRDVSAVTSEYNIGGALAFDANFDTVVDTDTVSAAFYHSNGSIIWVDNDGTHNTGANIAIARDATALLPISVIGYDEEFGDDPTGDDRPYIDAEQGSDTFSFDNYWIIKNLRLKTDNANGLRADNGSIIQNCKVENVSDTAERTAIYAGGAGATIINCYGKSDAGYGIRAAAAGGLVCGSYAEGATAGIYTAAVDNIALFNNIIVNSNDGVLMDAASNSINIIGNTIDNCTASGISGADGVNITIMGNSISNNLTGSGFSTTTLNNILDYNNFYGNTEDTAGLPTGAHGTSLDPQYVSAETGNYAIGTNLKALGLPNYFGGSSTTSYTDIGAAQREEEGTSERTVWIVTR